MSELQLALVVLGAVLLFGLYLYGKWQERRAARAIDASMREGVGDPLAASPAPAGPRRIEPRLDSPEDAAGEPDEPGAPAVADAGRSEPSAYALADGWVEDPLLDFVLELRSPHPLDGVAALEARAQLDRLSLHLPVHLAVWDARAQQWTGPDRFGFYSELLVAVQLANRRGVLGEIDAARFVAAAQQIAVAADAEFDGPDMARLLAQAAELDRLCARFDVQITLTLESTAAPWNAAALEAAALQAGLAPAGALCWEARAAGPRALQLRAGEAPTSSLSLVLDAPLARAEAAPLGMLFTIANALAARLGARVVDDNGRPVQTAAQGVIEAQLTQLVEQMRAAGIEPGAQRALRLYSA